MNSAFEDDRDLAAALGRLPATRTPARDLWPGIAARLGERRVDAASRNAGWRLPALAASVAVAFAAGILFGQRVPVGDRPADAAAQTLPGPGYPTPYAASEREYQAAFRALAPIDVAPAVFGAQDIESIRASWAALQQAESGLLTALRQYPDNPYLNARLLDLRAQQLDFMKQLVMLDQNSRSRI